MGVVRLLAKGWLLFCLFAGAHAVHLALASGRDPAESIGNIALCVVLFLAMGLLFIAGYGASAAPSNVPLLQRLKPAHLIPGFNDAVFLLFVILSFVNQIAFAPDHIGDGVSNSLDAAIHFAVPGLRALEDALAPCALDGGRIFAAAFTWLLALIFLGSALSRLRLVAGIIRLERATRPEALGASVVAVVLSTIAIFGVQLLFMGTAYSFLPCTAFTDVSGAILIGLAPLLLSYLVVAALAALLASGPEK